MDYVVLDIHVLSLVKNEHFVLPLFEKIWTVYFRTECYRTVL